MYIYIIKLYTYYYSCRYSIFLCCTNFVYSLSWQVLKDGGRGSRALRGSFVGAWWEGYFHSTPTLRRALYRQYGDTPAGASSSASCPPGEEVGGEKRGGRGGRGRGRGRQAATPSSPPPPADSPEHRTARVDPSEVEATRTPVHEPRVDEPSAHEPRPTRLRPELRPTRLRCQRLRPRRRPDGIPGRILHQPEPSGHADGGGDQFSDSEGEVVEGATVYQRGGTRLPPVPATREQRWLIRPDGEK